jgi:hypothetical protein
MKLSLLLFLSICSLGAVKSEAQSASTTPKSIAVTLSSLTSLQVQPDEAASFPVSTKFYTSLCNVIGSDQKGHDVLYAESKSERLAPYIICSLENGVYHYSVVPGAEQSILGYSQSVDSATLGDRFAASPASESNIWIYLSATDPHPHQKRDGLGKEYDEYISNDGASDLFISLHEGNQPVSNQYNWSMNAQPDKLISDTISQLPIEGTVCKEFVPVTIAFFVQLVILLCPFLGCLLVVLFCP